MYPCAGRARVFSSARCSKRFKRSSRLLRVDQNLFALYQNLFAPQKQNDQLGAAVEQVYKIPYKKLFKLIGCWPVSQRCDHKSVGTANEFILIREVHISDGNNTFISFFTEIESRLLQPFKICRHLDILATLVRYKVMALMACYVRTFSSLL